MRYKKSMIIILFILIIMVIKVYGNNQDIQQEFTTKTLDEPEGLEHTSLDDITENTLDYNKVSGGKVEEIKYTEGYKQEDKKYMVLFTHEKCDFCMDLWLNDINKYLNREKRLNLYVVDLKEEINTGAWEENDIPGVPLLMVVEDGILQERVVGLKEIKKILEDN